jgi:hypothetical protein
MSGVSLIVLSEYEEVDLEDLFPHSIVLGQRGQFLELLEPRKAFIYYQNLRTGMTTILYQRVCIS